MSFQAIDRPDLVDIAPSIASIYFYVPHLLILQGVPWSSEATTTTPKPQNRPRGTDAPVGQRS